MSSETQRISFVADDAPPKVNFLKNQPPKMLLYSLIAIFWPSDHLGPIEPRHLSSSHPNFPGELVTPTLWPVPVLL